MSLAQGAQLDINRLFEAPALAGPALSGLRIAADGSSIWYLRNSVTDANRLDLWKFDLPSGSSHRILGAEQLLSSGDALPPEELARRERQRTASLSGIVDYALIPGQQALRACRRQAVPGGGTERCAAGNHHARCGQPWRHHRCNRIAPRRQRRVCQRAESAADRSARRRIARADARWRRNRQERHGRIRRAGGMGAARGIGGRPTAHIAFARIDERPSR